MMHGLGTIEKRIAGAIAGWILTLVHIVADPSCLALVLRAESNGVLGYKIGLIGIVAVAAAGSIALSETLFGRSDRP